MEKYIPEMLAMTFVCIKNCVLIITCGWTIVTLYKLSGAEEHKIPYQGIPVGTIKKHATGKGNASKELVQATIKEWGFSPKDDNEADAIALLHCVLEGAF